MGLHTAVGQNRVSVADSVAQYLRFPRDAPGVQ